MSKPILTIQVPSKTTPGDFHSVFFYEDGRVECNCLRNGYFKMHCSHIDIAKREVSRQAEEHRT